MREEVTIRVDDKRTVSGLLDRPASPGALLVLAHGAGAGMRHHFLEDLTAALTSRGVAVLRYQFPYMEAGGRGTDRPPVAHATVRAALALAAERAPDLPLFAGGKSFGGRMTSQAMADGGVPGVRAAVFVGFPLHPAGKPGTERAEHLARVAAPMLFLQGTRDALADLGLVRGVVAQLGRRATLHIEEDADHSFAVRKRSGRDNREVIDSLARTIDEWAQRVT